MSKSRDAFRTISEVSDVLDTPAHVLRFWESKFAQVKPVKRAGGRRYYRPADVDLLAGIKQLLHDDGMTIKGAQKLLRENGVKHVAALGAQTLTDEAVDAAPVDVTPAAEVDTPLEPAPADPIENVTPVISPEPNTIEATADTNVVPLTTADAFEELPTQDTVAFDISAVPADPADSDSKAPARIFHLLSKTAPDRLAAQSGAITPILARMRTLRARIDAR